MHVIYRSIEHNKEFIFHFSIATYYYYCHKFYSDIFFLVFLCMSMTSKLENISGADSITVEADVTYIEYAYLRRINDPAKLNL